MRTGADGRDLADAIAQDLIDDARLKCRLVGAGAALPMSLIVAAIRLQLGPCPR